MNIPNKLKILGYDYTVKKDPKQLRDDNRFGYQCATLLEICIDSSAPEQMQESTLLHEIIEAINYHNELKLDHNAITTLEAGLYQVLKDNNLFGGK